MIPVTECAFPRAFCRKIRRGRNGAGTGLIGQANIPKQKLTVDTMWRIFLFPPYACAVRQRREVIAMIQLAAGIILGILFSAVAAMVGCCIHMEKKYPEIRDKYLSETER